MGVLTKKPIMKKKKQTSFVYQLSETYQDPQKFTDLYDSIMFYLPYQPYHELSKMQSEIRKVLLTDIQLLPKL